jgi:hydrogenase nickel incorporation protein HypA/HybF
VEEPSLRQAFQMLAEGTPAEGARVELVTVPADLDCRACGHNGTTLDVLAVCPRCHGDDVAVTGGDELLLETVAYAAPAVA